MLNRISKTVAYTTQLVLQISNVNLGNYIHAADYPNEHNIRYAEILDFINIRDLFIFKKSIKPFN